MNDTSQRHPIRHGLICLSLTASLLLSACAIPITIGGTGPAPSLSADASASEVELHNRSAAMTKTVVEAIALGATAGAVLGLLDRSAAGNPYGNLGFGGYLLAGAVAGAAAGTYVGFLQRDFANEEERLTRARADIRASNAETSATLQVMRQVLASQTRELADLRAAVAAGTADTAQLDREIAAARVNLREMQQAANGAAKRHQDFSKARALVAVDNDNNNINGELDELGERIAQMRQVADDLANQI